MRSRNQITHVFAAILACALAACGSGELVSPAQNDPSGPAASGNLDAPGELRIFRASDPQVRDFLAGVYPGDTVRLEAKRGSAAQDVEWQSNAPQVASVDDDGMLSVHAAGDCTVTASDGDSSKSLKVHVGEAPPFLGSDPVEASPTPQATPTASPNPTDTPAATATPDATPRSTPAPTATPVPSAPPSDPFMDEVTSFNPGPSAGFGSDQFPDIVLGGPHGSGTSLGSFDVLSLGRGGEIVLKSDRPILDGSGADFIVFENAFYAGGNPEAPFAEPGEVSVSQDGITFLSFACAQSDNAGHYPGCAGVHPVYANVESNSIDPTDPAVAGGDAFDLQTVGLPWARYVKIRDVSLNGGGNSAGFDLDAISIVHQ